MDQASGLNAWRDLTRSPRQFRDGRRAGESPVPRARREDTPDGDWLIAVFDRRYRAPEHEPQLRRSTRASVSVLGRLFRSKVVELSAIPVVEIDGGLDAWGRGTSHHDWSPI
ncbi:hypothetical protein GCM10009733_108910 [Nonomuraea maheshkhaliensis]|uniref:Uncharacterized protein n=1 Tax=Nonomuraea maheshkhaliensis TaxID=419590 RepID=A0ABP4TZE4_9ACTN